MRQGARGMWTLPSSLWSAFRRPFLLLLLIYGTLAALIDPSVIGIRNGAALGALVVGPGAIITLITVMAYRRFELVPFVPAYLIFRLIRAYFAIDMLLTLPVRPPKRMEEDEDVTLSRTHPVNGNRRLTEDFAMTLPSNKLTAPMNNEKASRH
jgi:hypothetical protein